jgi:hypothetical protein
MADDRDTLRPTAEQYRQRAKLVRRKVEATTNPEMRWLLREIAAEYEELADRLNEGGAAPIGDATR